MLNLYRNELVVLSVCVTGLGEANDTEGIYGLQCAFKQAGVNKLIVSLWKVPDQQAQELMDYYIKVISLDNPSMKYWKLLKVPCEKNILTLTIGLLLFW